MSDCVNWKGYRDKDGYGRLSKPKEGERAAHRVAWVEAHGPIPPGMCVLSPSHKLSTEQVGQIRKERTLGESLKVLSVRYAVGITTVWEIVQRRTWREVR